MFYHDHHFQRQRYRERFAEMREEYRRAQAPSPRGQQSRRSVSFAQQMRSMVRRMRRRSAQRAPAFRA